MTISAKGCFTETTRVSNKHFDGRDQRIRRRHNMTHDQNSNEHDLQETNNNKNVRVNGIEEEQNAKKKIVRTSIHNTRNFKTCRDITEEKKRESNSDNINNDAKQSISSVNQSTTLTRTSNNSSNDYNKRHYMDIEDMDFNFRAITNDEELFIEDNTSKNPLVIDSESVQTESNNSQSLNKRRKMIKPRKRKVKQPKKRQEDELDESSDDDDQEKYEVESILGHKVYRNMVVKYEIKWVGYPHKFNTWEPSSSIHQDCLKMCIDYWSKHKEKPINAPTTTTTTEDKEEKKNSINYDKSTPSFKQKEYNERIKVNKITNEDLHYSLRNQGFELAYATGFPTETTNWIFEMRQIHLVQKIEGTDQILAYVSWQNRKKTVHVVQELHDKCPGELIAYYEARIRFED